jgi:hypothetical protein
MSQWMIDTSALAQRSHSEVDQRLRQSLRDGAVVCDMVVAESLVRARSEADLLARQRFFETIDILSIDNEVWDEVFDLAAQLAADGKVVATGDAVIAACARLHGLTVLHYDSDYSTLGDVAEIEHEWVTEPGSL